MPSPPSNVTRLPVQPARRIVARHPPAERARGIATDLREAIAERELSRDDLRGILQRLDALARDLEGTPT